MRTACALAEPLVELEDAIVTFDENLAWPMSCRNLASLRNRMGLRYEDTNQARGADLLHRPSAFDSLDEELAKDHVGMSTHPTCGATACRRENRLMRTRAGLSPGGTPPSSRRIS